MGLFYKTYLPEQRVSFKEKQKEKWYIPTAEYMIAKCQSANSNKRVQQALYNAVNGIINEEDYRYVLNPFHAEEPKLQQFPARMRNHDLITPIILRYIGEYIKQPFKAVVGINNSDVSIKRKQEQFEKLKPLLNAQFQKTLIDNGAAHLLPDGGQEFNQTMSPEEQEQIPKTFKEVLAQIEQNWNDFRVKQGQQAIAYLNDKLKLDYKFWTAYFDWITSSSFFTYRSVYRDTIEFKIIPPLEAYPLDNGEDFVEDMPAFLHIYQANIYDIYEEARDELSETDKQYLDNMINKYNRGLNTITVTDKFIADRFGTVYDVLGNSKKVRHRWYEGNGLINVYHIAFKTLRKIKILKYINNVGEEHEVEVSEDYKLDKSKGDISITSEWIPEVLEMKRYGDEYTGVYTKPKRVVAQRSQVNNSANVKLPFGGKIGLFRGFDEFSVVKTLLPYQVVYNIIHYYREMAIAKNKGKVLVMPKGLLVNDDEITTEEALYYLKSDGTLYADETAENFNVAIQGLKQLDLSDAQYITGLSQILADIKEEAMDAVMMNRQRYGNTYASDGKATTEQSIFRASIASAPINEVFNLARCNEYLSLLDYSKFAWATDDEKYDLGSYLSEDGRVEYFTITPKEYIESDFGVFVHNITKEQDKIAAYKEIAFSAAQNGAFEVAVEAIEAENTNKLKSIIKAWRELEDQRAQQQQQQQQQQVQATIEAQKENAQLDRELKLQIAQTNAEATIKAAQIRTEGVIHQADTKLQSDTEKHQVERERFNTDNLTKREIEAIKQANDIIKTRMQSVKQPTKR